MSSNKRIILVTPGFPAHEQDSVCIPPLQAFVMALVNQYPQAEVIVIALHYPKRRKVYRWNNVMVYPLNGVRYFQYLKTLVLMWNLPRLLTHLHREKPIDIIHSFWLNESTFLAQRFSLKYGLPHFATIMGQDAWPANRYRKLIRFNKLHIIALSNNAADVFTKSTNQKVHSIIPWGLSGSEVTVEMNNRTIDVLGVASLIPLKNNSLFIGLMEKLISENLLANAVIAGKGPEMEPLQQLLQKLRLEKQIKLAGEIPQEEVLQLMRRSKVFLHTSSYEGQGYVFLEALAAGLPVVCFSVGFLPDSQKVHVCNDENEMLETLRKLLIQPQDYEPVSVPTIQETVNAHWKIYF
ncbi:MAG: glycosyltransferase [Bacteroidia bacterium]